VIQILNDLILDASFLARLGWLGLEGINSLIECSIVVGLGRLSPVVLVLPMDVLLLSCSPSLDDIGLVENVLERSRLLG
jgi:hypothetical protein